MEAERLQLEKERRELAAEEISYITKYSDRLKLLRVAIRYCFQLIFLAKSTNRAFGLNKTSRKETIRNCRQGMF